MFTFTGRKRDITWNVELHVKLAHHNLHPADALQYEWLWNRASFPALALLEIQERREASSEPSSSFRTLTHDERLRTTTAVYNLLQLACSLIKTC